MLSFPKYDKAEGYFNYKTLQPSVGLMKWLAVAEDLDDLFGFAGGICCVAELEAHLFQSR